MHLYVGIPIIMDPTMMVAIIDGDPPIPPEHPNPSSFTRTTTGPKMKANTEHLTLTLMTTPMVFKTM